MSAARRALVQSRALSTSRVVWQEAAAVPPPAVNVGTTPMQKKPVGGFRGGFEVYRNVQ